MLNKAAFSVPSFIAVNNLKKKNPISLKAPYCCILCTIIVSQETPCNFDLNRFYAQNENKQMKNRVDSKSFVENNVLFWYLYVDLTPITSIVFVNRWKRET